jgi:hypothetical protein
MTEDRNSVVGIANIPRAERSEFRIPVRAGDFVFSGAVAHPVSYSVGTGVLSREKRGRG